jgi:hypothetical protein
MVCGRHCGRGGSIRSQRNEKAPRAPSGESNQGVAPIEHHVTPWSSHGIGNAFVERDALFGGDVIGTSIAANPADTLTAFAYGALGLAMRLSMHGAPLWTQGWSRSTGQHHR